MSWTKPSTLRSPKPSGKGVDAGDYRLAAHAAVDHEGREAQASLHKAQHIDARTFLRGHFRGPPARRLPAGGADRLQSEARSVEVNQIDLAGVLLSFQVLQLGVCSSEGRPVALCPEASIGGDASASRAAAASALRSGGSPKSAAESEP